MIRQGSLAPSKSCNREELHIRPVSFNLYILLLLHKVKNIAYSLKYKGQPILKALIFKDRTLFLLYGDKSGRADEKWSIFCNVSKQGCHRHLQFQLFNASL